MSLLNSIWRMPVGNKMLLTNYLRLVTEGSKMLPVPACLACQRLSTTPVYERKLYPSEPKVWPKYNDIVYPPQKEGEPRRPATLNHFRANIKYSQKKMWYIALMIRGMSVDEAKKQLSFYERKGAAIAREVIEEAQEMAIQDHNVEFRSNLWIADARVTKAITIKGIRMSARGRRGIIHYRYCHLFLTLQEGRPPKHYYPPPDTGHQKMEEYIQNLRKRSIFSSL